MNGRLSMPSAHIVAFIRALPSSSAICAVTTFEEWISVSGTLTEAPML